jgi:1-acyl-sn-glycerol-3-phosphate acyltransferase
MIGRVLRTAIGIPLIALGVIVLGTIIGVAGDTPFSDRLLRVWCRLVLLCAGAKVVARAVPLDPGRSYVYVSNHTSHIDVPSIVSVAPLPIRFIGKQQLRRIPLFGWAAERMGHVFIDRRDSNRAAKAIADRLQRGLSGVGLLFFAEGTRATSDELLPFKKGAAVSAVQMGLDCVPLGVAGAREVLAPRGFPLFRPGRVAIVFGPPIPISGWTLDQRDALVQTQRTAVESCVRAARDLLSKGDRILN